MQLNSRPLDRLVAHAPAGLGLWGPDLRCLVVNACFARATGIPADEHPGRTLGETLPHLPPETLAALRRGERPPDVELAVDGARWLASFFPVPTIGLGAVLREVTELSHRATHDALTGLPDRLLFAERISAAVGRAERAGTDAAVFFIDLDAFKQVNDQLGHAAGDELLEVARRLRAAVRPSDTVGRLGGDEFGVLCEDLDDQQGAIAAAERVLTCLCEPVWIDGRRLTSSASVGVAYSSDQCGTADELMRRADVAMYRAKQHGGGRWEVFDRAMRTQLRRRLELEQALRHAAERDELRLHFQPQVSAATGAPVAVEALVRWQHPERGLLAPGEFIAAAEATGAIHSVGEWVLDAACEAAARLHGPDGAPLRVSINLSPSHLERASLVDTIGEALDRHGVPAERLGLEITETQAMHDTRANAITFAALRALGVRIVLDDFGTGYSSLAYLRRLPVDEIKLDRLFVHRLMAADGGLDERIARFVVGLGKALAVETVAEGIETAAQADALRELGFDILQGYHVGRPVALDELGAIL